MIKNNFNKTRFFLFTNSYSGQLISRYFRKKYKNKGFSKSKKLAGEIKYLSRVLFFNKKYLTSFIFNIKPECPLKRVSSQIKIYLEIEKELGNVANEKSDKYSTAKEDYQRQLLYPAFERAAGNSLGKIKNYHEFNTKLGMKINEYGNVYYKVAYKYKIPTIRIVPFLLRLISDK